jgi:hypothetical protein
MGLLAGCGGGSGGAPVPASEFPARFAAGWCGLMQRCCQASGGTSAGACEADLMAQTTSTATQATAAGATWDAAAAGRCLEGIRAADCAGANVATLVALLDSCDDTWIGVVPAGGACTTHASCAEPQVSGGATAGASCVNAMCVPIVRQPVGATCDSTMRLCNPLEGACGGGVCVALPGPGQPCDGDCKVGARCRNNVCEALLAMGATCAADADCLSDRCSAGKCASTLASEAEYCTLP